MYKHSQNGKVVVSAEQDPKTKTYLLTFDDGKTTSCSPSTFKRYYKKIDDGMEEEAVKGDEDTCADGRKYSDIGKEIAEQAKQKVEKAKKEKKASGIAIEEAQKLITEQVNKAGYETVITEKNPKTVWILISAKKAMGVYVGTKKCVLGMPEAMVPKGYKADKVRNCPISHSFDIAYEEIDKLSEMLGKVNA